MPEVPHPAFAHYLAMWNERDPDRVRGHLDQAVADDVLFVDPVNVTRGPDEMEAMVLELLAEQPGARFEVASGYDGHHGRYRYRWNMHVDGSRVVEGFDVTTVNDAGMIERIDGFFGPLPGVD